MAATLNLSTLRKMPERHRRAWLRAARAVQTRTVREDKPLRGDARWWLDPAKTPEETTAFVLLVYLWQAKMLDLTPETKQWAFAKAFLRTKADEATLFLVLERMRRHYALPQHWKGLRQYVGRVLRSVQGPDDATRPPVPRRTYFRWKSRGLGQGEIEARRRHRLLRREAMAILTERGKSDEAARKLIARRLQAGESLTALISRLRRGGRP
jgi:hypothetical protein